MGAEAEDCHLSGFTNVYINGHIGDISILGTHKYKKRLHHNHCFYKIKHSFERDIFRALRLYYTSTTHNFPKIVLGG